MSLLLLEVLAGENAKEQSLSWQAAIQKKGMGLRAGLARMGERVSSFEKSSPHFTEIPDSLN